MGRRKAQSPERAQRRAMNRAMAKAEKRQRAASGPSRQKPVLTTPASRGVANPLMKRGPSPAEKRQAAQGQTIVGQVMLAGCPVFTARYVNGQVQVVDEGRIRPAVCDACGRVPDHVFNTGDCPRIIDSDTAMAMMLPPDVLHSPPEEAGLIVP